MRSNRTRIAYPASNRLTPGAGPVRLRCETQQRGRRMDLAGPQPRQRRNKKARRVSAGIRERKTPVRFSGRHDFRKTFLTSARNWATRHVSGTSASQLCAVPYGTPYPLPRCIPGTNVPGFLMAPLRGCLTSEFRSPALPRVAIQTPERRPTFVSSRFCAAAGRRHPCGL